MSVAIRTAVRIQDQDDAPSLGAGQDGYALTWDNASGAFVATALSAGVTDHGALTGLTPDDDHTQYALLAGRAGGQTLYGGDAANDDITIHGTSNGTRTTSYVLLQPSGGNVGIGTSAPGQQLHVVGRIRITPTTPGDGDQITMAAENTALQMTGASTYAKGGSFQLYGETHASYPGDVYLISGGATASPASTIQFGYRNSSGYSAKMTVLSTGRVGIGTTAPATLLHGLLTSAATNAVANVLTIGHDTSGTAANGFGAGLLWQLESSTTAAQDAAQIGALWTTATHATRASALTFSTLTAGGSLTERMRIDGAGNVGIGTSTPAAKCQIVQQAEEDIFFTEANTTAYGANWVQRRSRGTNASKTVLQDGDIVGGMIAQGYDGSAYRNAGRVAIYIDGTPGSSDMPGRIEFRTTPDGSATEQIRMVIKNTGLVGIGTTAPAAFLHVDQSSTTGAVPVLTVDQADVSEEFIRFVGSSATDASQSLVDAADMTTPGALTGWLKIYVQDDQATNPITDGTYYVPFYSAPTA